MKLNQLLITMKIICYFSAVIDAKPCKYWCKTSRESFYCCPDGNNEDMKITKWNEHSNWPFGIFLLNIFASTMGFPYDHDKALTEVKHCPPQRSHCPRSSWDWDPPKYCDKHKDCYHSNEACCYDVCIDHRVCKLVEH